MLTENVDKEKSTSIIDSLKSELAPSIRSWWKRWKKSAMDPQRVIEQSTSSNITTRRKIAEKIADYHEWDDSECLTIAQSLTYKMQVALARNKTSDLRLFLPPPELPALYSQSELGETIRQLLDDMPTGDVKKCIRYYTADALNTTEEYQIKNSHSNRAWDFDHANDQSFDAYDTLRLVEVLCLKALLKHSQIEENCHAMVNGGILQILQHCNRIYPNDTEIQELIVRMVGNIAAFEYLHQFVYTSGWVTLLAHAIRSPETYISMQAHRALANLDTEEGSAKFKDGIFLISPLKRANDKPVADIVFVHGMLGGAFYTWRQRDCVKEKRTDCWPKDWFPEDLPQCRVMSMEYDTALTEWRSICPYESEIRTMEHRSKKMLEKAKLAGLGDRPIIWVSHSMGGLIVKQILKLADENQEEFGKVSQNTKGVVFYGTPHFGTHIASYSKRIRSVLYPSIEVQELMQDSPKLQIINDFVREKVESGKLKVLSFSESKPTRVGFGISFNVHIVPPESANPGYGEFITADCNHFEICKPRDRDNPIYTHMLNFCKTNIGPSSNALPEDGEDAKYFDDIFYW